MIAMKVTFVCDACGKVESHHVQGNDYKGMLGEKRQPCDWFYFENYLWCPKHTFKVFCDGTPVPYNRGEGELGN